MPSEAGMGVTQRNSKHANCQHDSLSNYRIIQRKLLGDNNNKSGLTRVSFETSGCLRVICYLSKAAARMRGEREGAAAWEPAPPPPSVGFDSSKLLEVEPINHLG